MDEGVRSGHLSLDIKFELIGKYGDREIEEINIRSFNFNDDNIDG